MQRLMAYVGAAILFLPATTLGQAFTISLSPATQTITAGATTNTTVRVAPATFPSAVTVSAITVGLPNQLTVSIPTKSLASPFTDGVLATVTTTSDLPPDTYTIDIVATSPTSPAATTQFTLVVQAPPATPQNSQVTPPGSTLKNDFGFGVALGLSWNAYGPDIVNNASIDANGIVRVNTRANTNAGFMLESHYYVLPRAKKANPDNGKVPFDTRAVGFGPFVCAQPGSSQIITAVGAGLMFGWRRQTGVTPSGFGLGFGYEAIPSAQVLGSEFVNGQPAPLGPDKLPLPLRYETQDKGSILFILSVSF